MADFQICRPPAPGGLTALLAEARLEDDAEDEVLAVVVAAVLVPEVGAGQRDGVEGEVSEVEVAKAMVLVDPERLVAASSS